MLNNLIPHYKSVNPSLDETCPESVLKYMFFQMLKQWDPNVLMVKLLEDAEKMLNEPSMVWDELHR
jgi:hypothetical protein